MNAEDLMGPDNPEGVQTKRRPRGWEAASETVSLREQKDISKPKVDFFGITTKDDELWLCVLFACDMKPREDIPKVGCPWT